MLFEEEHGIIIACDVFSLQKFEELVEKTCHIEGVVGYKVGAILGLTYGLKKLTSVVKEHCSLPTIYDHQKAGTDIPQMAEKFAKACSDADIKGFIIFPQAGPKMEEAFINAVLKENMTPLVGGEMTHPAYIEKEGGFMRNDAPEEMYKIGASMGVEYFILPGNRIEAIKKYHSLLSSMIENPRYCMPGIGRQGGEIGKTFSLLKGFPAYAIIGSSIYNSKDITKATKEFCKEALKFGR